jgi:hypothetical protein
MQFEWNGRKNENTVNYKMTKEVERNFVLVGQMGVHCTLLTMYGIWMDMKLN